jgi:hypothetical protein
MIDFGKAPRSGAFFSGPLARFWVAAAANLLMQKPVNLSFPWR